MKVFSVILTIFVLGAAALFAFNHFYRDAASIDIIGGADGPTAIFIAGSWD